MKTCLFASFVSLGADCVLAAIKFLAGIVASSHSLVSDGIHSCADAVSCLIVLWGTAVRTKGRAPGKLSPDTTEKISLITLSVILISTGFTIGFSGFRRIFFFREEIATPEPAASAVALFALLVKTGLFIYSYYVAERHGSRLIMANARHHLSDALSCLGSFAGILGARLGYPVLDTVAGIIISVLVIGAGIRVGTDARKKQ